MEGIMTDMLKAISTLEKAHDYFGKAESLVNSINKVSKAAKIDPKDPKQLKQLVGITDKESEKLTKTLNARAKAVEEAEKGEFPKIPSKLGDKWAKWAKECDKNGVDSKQAHEARKAYLKEAARFDKDLEERLLVTNIMMLQSKKQEKVYIGLVALHKTAEKTCLAVIKSPSTTSTAPQATAMKSLLKFQGVPGPAIRIHNAHAKIIAAAKSERKRVEKLKKENDALIADLAAKDLKDLKVLNANMKKLLSGFSG
jgi:hypothetical protein